MFLDEKRQGEITEAPAKVLKLSEALRKGAQEIPACSGLYFKNGSACAWGAAAIGYGAEPGDIHAASRLHRETLQKHPELHWVMTRNDQGMTREEIADRLESQGL